MNVYAVNFKWNGNRNNAIFVIAANDIIGIEGLIEDSIPDAYEYGNPESITLLECTYTGEEKILYTYEYEKKIS